MQISPFYSASIVRQPDRPPAMDRVVWRWTEHGSFSTSSAYARLHDCGERNNINLSLWTIKVPVKIRVFIWVAMRDRLLTQHILLSRGCNVPIGCHLCRDRNMETTEHIYTIFLSLRSRLLAGANGQMARWYAVLGGALNTPCWDLWWSRRTEVLPQYKNLWDFLWAAGCCNIWKERNMRLNFHTEMHCCEIPGGEGRA